MVNTESTKYLRKIQNSLIDCGKGEAAEKLDEVFRQACLEIRKMGSRKIAGKPLKELLPFATMKDYADLVEMFGPLFVFDRKLERDHDGNTIQACKVKMMGIFPAIIVIELIKMTEGWSILDDYNSENKITFKIEISDENYDLFKAYFKRFCGFLSLLPEFIDWVSFKIKLSENQMAALKNKKVVAIQELEAREEEDVFSADKIFYENTCPYFAVLVNKDDIIKTAEDYKGNIPPGFLFMVKEESGFAYSFLFDDMHNEKSFKKTKEYLKKIKTLKNIIAFSEEYTTKIKNIDVLSFSFIIERKDWTEMVFYNYMCLDGKVINLMIQTVLEKDEINEAKQLYIKHPLLLSARKIIESIDYSKINEEPVKLQKNAKKISFRFYTCDEYGFSMRLPGTYSVKNAGEAIKEGHHKDTLFTVKTDDNFFFRILYEGPCSKKPFETAIKMINALREAPNTVKASKAYRHMVNDFEVVSFCYCANDSKYSGIFLTFLNFVKINDHIINFTCILNCENNSQANSFIENPVLPKLIKHVKFISVSK